MGIGMGTERLKILPDDKVFLDKQSVPFLIRKGWLYYWHKNKCWVTLREINESDNFPDNLTHEEQAMYFEAK